MGVIIGVAIAIAAGAAIIGLCAASGRAGLEQEIIRSRDGGK